MAADNNDNLFTSDNLLKLAALLEVIGDSLALLSLEKQSLEENKEKTEAKALSPMFQRRKRRMR